MNCSTPIDWWLHITLKELSRWIKANNNIRRKAKEEMES